MKEKPGDKQRLQHILDAIDEVEAYTKGSTLDNFLHNSMMRFASVKQIEIIGEAANYLTKETKEKFSSVEWGKLRVCGTFLFMNILELMPNWYGRL